VNESAMTENAEGRNSADGEAGTLSLRVCVLNEQGLHARPAARLAQEAQKFPCEVRLAGNDGEVDAKSILDILTLAAGQGANLELRTNGPEADSALEYLAGLFKNRFR
jgi:phosphocarrier protein HPr